MGLGIYQLGTEARGTLQPVPAPEEALRCDVCGCWWVPDASTFGCPSCHLQREEAQGADG